MNVDYEFFLFFLLVHHMLFFSNMDDLIDRCWWLYSSYFVRCCFQLFFKLALSILVCNLSSILAIHFLSVILMHPCSSIYSVTVYENSPLISLDWSCFQMIDNLTIETYTIGRRLFISLSIDEMLLLLYVNCLTNFKVCYLKWRLLHFCLRHMNSSIFAFTM